MLSRVSRATSALGSGPCSRIACRTMRSLYWRMPTWFEPTVRGCASAESLADIHVPSTARQLARRANPFGDMQRRAESVFQVYVRAHRSYWTLTWSAPVMIATASDILISRGLDHGRALAQPLDVDAVGHLEHVRHVVADQDHRQAVVAHPADQLEHHVRLLDAERGGRLVHDHDVPGEGRAARHRHALALAAGERLDRLLHRADADLQVLHVRDRVGLHLLLVQQAQQRCPGCPAGASRGRGTGSRRSSSRAPPPGPGRPSRCRAAGRRSGCGSAPACRPGRSRPRRA